MAKCEVIGQPRVALLDVFGGSKHEPAVAMHVPRRELENTTFVWRSRGASDVSVALADTSCALHSAWNGKADAAAYREPERERGEWRDA